MQREGQVKGSDKGSDYVLIFRKNLKTQKLDIRFLSFFCYVDIHAVSDCSATPCAERTVEFCARAKFHLVKKPLREPTLVYRLRTPYLEKQASSRVGNISQMNAII